MEKAHDMIGTVNVDITEIEVIDTSNVFECITHHTSLALLILRFGDH